MTKVSSKHYEQAVLNRVTVTVATVGQPYFDQQPMERTVSVDTQVFPGQHSALLGDVYVNGQLYVLPEPPVMTTEEARALVLMDQRKSWAPEDMNDVEIIEHVNTIPLADIDDDTLTSQAYKLVLS